MGNDDEERARWVLVEKMAGDMEAIRDQVSLIPSINDRLGRVEGDVQEIKGELVVHREILREHGAELKELRSDVTELRSDVTEIKQIVGGHMEKLAELEAHTH